MKRPDHCSLVALSLKNCLPLPDRSAGLLAIALLAFCLGANAADINWTRSGGSTGNTSWTNSANWSGGVPTSGDDVYFLSNSVAAVSGPTAAVANNLNINTGGVKVGGIDAGTLSVGGTISVGASGSGSFTLNKGTVSANTIEIYSGGSYTDRENGTLILTGDNAGWGLDEGVTTTVNSEIQGTNGLRLRGTGKLVLANDNTYSGGTTIEEGTLQIANGGTLGEGNVTNNGTLTFNRSDEDDSFVVTNQISGDGRVRQDGSGKTIITGDNTYTGGTTISSGTLQVGNGGTNGSLGSGIITNNADLIYNLSSDVVVSNRIVGTGNFTQDGSNTVVFTARNTYAGTTTIGTNGTLQVGAGSTNGTLGTGSVIDNGVLAYNRSDSIVVSNLISGTGSLRQDSTNTLTLTANNTYEGTTTIATNGTIRVGNGRGTGSLGSSNVFNYGTLIFDRTNAYMANNIIEGTGKLVLAGNSNSILTLTASNSYNGGTRVESGGTLVVATNFALGSGDVVLDKGTLKASATQSTNKIIIHVGGDYIQSADSTLQLAIGGAVSNDTTNQYDRVKVAGEANLGGELHVVGANGYTPHHQDKQTLLTADGGVINTFTSFSNDISHSVLLMPTLVYGSNDLALAWEQLSFINYLTSSNNIPLNHNQKAVARALDSIATSTASNDVALIDYLDYLPGELTNDLPAAFDRIAPEELTAMIRGSFANMDAQGSEFLNRARELRTNYRRVYASEFRDHAPAGMQLRADFDTLVNKPLDIYLGLPFNKAEVKGDKNANGYDIKSSGVIVGGDRRVGNRIVWGGAIGYTDSKSDFSGGGDVEQKSFNAQLYGLWIGKGLHFEGMLGGNINNYDTKRKSLSEEAGVNDIAKGSTDGLGWTAFLGGGYDIENGPWVFGPQVAVQYMSASISEYTEKGSLAPLRIESQTEDALNSQLGLNLRYRYIMSDKWTIITPEVYFGWRHDFTGNSVSLDSKFASGAGDTFTVDGPELGANSVVASLGFTIQWNPSFNTYFDYTTQKGRSGYSSQNFNLGARVCF